MLVLQPEISGARAPVSSELPELLNLSTRLLVLREGRVVGEVPREHASQDVLLRLMTGFAPAP